MLLVVSMSAWRPVCQGGRALSFRPSLPPHTFFPFAEPFVPGLGYVRAGYTEHLFLTFY